MRKDTKNFINSSEYDLNTAQFLFDTGRFIYVIFMCHLSLEKILKAIVAEITQNIPPKSHNLIYLIKLGRIELPKDFIDFIAKINNASIVTRYPEDFSRVLDAYPKNIAREYLSTTKEIHRWLKENKKLTE
jgi:HEPN domain-containing protein